MDVRITEDGKREVLVTAKKGIIPYGKMASLAEEFKLSFTCYTLANGTAVYRFYGGFENSNEENKESLEKVKAKIEKLFENA